MIEEPRKVAVRFITKHYDTVSEDIARACLSGHNSPPLSDEYWTCTPSASYRILPFKERSIGTLAMVRT